MDKIYNELLVIIDFLQMKAERKITFERMRKAIENAYEKRNEKGLRQAKRDVDAWVSGLNDKDKITIQSLLDKQIPEVPEDVLKIINKNKVADFVEYRALHEAPSDYDLSSDLIVIISDLLDSYEGPFSLED